MTCKKSNLNIKEMSSIDTINVCKLRMRTKKPCGRTLYPGEKFCNLCSAHKQHLKDLRKEEMRIQKGEEHLQKLTLEDVDAILKCFKPIKN